MMIRRLKIMSFIAIIAGSVALAGCAHSFKGTLKSGGKSVGSDSFMPTTDLNYYPADVGEDVYEITFKTRTDLVKSSRRYELSYYGILTDCVFDKFNGNVRFEGYGTVGKYPNSPDQEWVLQIQKYALQRALNAHDASQLWCLKLGGRAMWGWAESQSNMMPIDDKIRADMLSFAGMSPSVKDN
jgi:hypothetical protein